MTPPATGPFGPESVSKRARRWIGDDSRNSANGESHSDELLIPFITGEVNREKRPHSRLHTGKKEIEPVKAAQCSPRRHLLSKHFWRSFLFRQYFIASPITLAHWLSRQNAVGNPFYPKVVFGGDQLHADFIRSRVLESNAFTH
jgi:hypothetical protein